MFRIPNHPVRRGNPALAKRVRSVASTTREDREMHPNRFSKVVGDVSREFDRPRDILDSADLSAEQKIKLLKEWEFDLRELQVASEENMASNASPGATADLLQECRRALARLGAGDSAGARAPTKQGGS